MDKRTYTRMMLVIMAIVSLTAIGMWGMCPSSTIAQAQEIGPNEVQGTVMFFTRGTMEVRSDQTDRMYTFYVGRRTIYYPQRYPVPGETVRVRYINDRGYLKATQVTMIPPVQTSDQQTPKPDTQTQTPSQQAQEIGPNEVLGIVLSIQIEEAAFGRRAIQVKSDQTGRIYLFYVGTRTIYYPQRYPVPGEIIKVHYVNDRGYLKATQVEIIQTPP